MTGELKVTPDRLISASSDFSRHDQKTRSITQQMMSLVNGLTGKWEGDDQRVYCSKFKGLQGDMDQIHAKIAEHSKDLQEMARNYQQTVQGNVSSFNGLKTDYI